MYLHVVNKVCLLLLAELYFDTAENEVSKICNEYPNVACKATTCTRVVSCDGKVSAVAMSKPRQSSSDLHKLHLQLLDGEDHFELLGPTFMTCERASEIEIHEETDLVEQSTIHGTVQNGFN